MSPGRTRTRVASLATLAFAALLVRAFAGCDEASSHVYLGRKYDPVRGCLGGTEGIEIISGPDVSNDCPVMCVQAAKLRDGASDLFVSTTCAPHPSGADPQRTDPRCADALAAFERADLCLGDGGSTSPIDAGPDADAATDASADAATDADADASADASADAGADAGADADASADAPDSG